MEKGYIQVYTGNGKGKTTAALGVALRSVGNGFKVAILQFVKSPGFEYNEMKAFALISGIEGYEGKIIMEQFGTGCCCLHDSAPSSADFEGARKGLQRATQFITSGEYDVVILDELNIALWLKLLDLQEVLTLLKNKPENVEVIVTGRHAPEEILEMADLVTEMKEVKHYFRKGIIARPGIER